MRPLKPHRGPVSERSKRQAERLLRDHLPELVQRALELALLGDPVALKVCLDMALTAPAPAPAAQPAKREVA